MSLRNFVEFETIKMSDKIKYELQAFSVFRAVSDFLKQKTDDIDIRSEAYYYRRWLKMVDNSNKQNKLIWVVKNIKRIGEDLNNKNYDKNDLLLSLLFISYYSKHVNLSDIKVDLVDRVVNMFSDKQYDIDKEFVKTLCEEMDTSKIEHFSFFFNILEDGESLVYKYIKKKYISPLFFINFLERINIENEKNSNCEYKKFKRTSQIIRKILNNENNKMC